MWTLLGRRPVNVPDGSIVIGQVTSLEARFLLHFLLQSTVCRAIIFIVFEPLLSIPGSRSGDNDPFDIIGQT